MISFVCSVFPFCPISQAERKLHSKKSSIMLCTITLLHASVRPLRQDTLRKLAEGRCHYRLQHPQVCKTVQRSSYPAKIPDQLIPQMDSSISISIFSLPQTQLVFLQGHTVLQIDLYFIIHCFAIPHFCLGLHLYSRLSSPNLPSTPKHKYNFLNQHNSIQVSISCIHGENEDKCNRG